MPALRLRPDGAASGRNALPECGADLGALRAITIGHRQRRVVEFFCGLAIPDAATRSTDASPIWGGDVLVKDVPV